MKIALRKTLLLLLTLAPLVLGIFASLLLCNPVLAEQSNRGAKIFSNNCTACHGGGGNIILGEKNLHKQALLKYHIHSIKAIAHQVKHGKKAMPAFKGRLSDRQIETVARYVLKQAEKGW